MDLHVPYRNLRSLEVAFGTEAGYEIIPARLVGGVWVVDDVPDHSWFSYIINGRFAVCDPLTTEWMQVGDNTFVTVKNSDSRNSNMQISTTLCASLDKDFNPIDVRSVFSLSDPLVLVVFEIHSQTPDTTVITAEWVRNDEIKWLTARPYLVKGRLVGYNAMKITDSTESGEWIVHIYEGTKLVDTHKFVIQTRSKSQRNLPPHAAFYDLHI